MAWPDNYAWAGTLPITGSNGDTRTTCLTHVTYSTTRYTDYPQPTAGAARSLAEAQARFQFDPSDPGGLSFSPIYDGANAWAFWGLATLFPGLPAMTSCTLGDPGPNWAGFTETTWMDPVTTTIFIGEEGQGPKSSLSNTMLGRTSTPAAPTPTDGAASPTSAAPAGPASTNQAASVVQSSSSHRQVQYTETTVTITSATAILSPTTTLPATAILSATIILSPTTIEVGLPNGGAGRSDGDGARTTSKTSQSAGQAMGAGLFLSLGAWVGIWFWFAYCASCG